ncbi:hypothetical protein M8J76_006744 [Diaphorina citri]|nr:hypothetical protein M8J76_006744 [Diaphorina citri]
MDDSDVDEWMEGLGAALPGFLTFCCLLCSCIYFLVEDLFFGRRWRPHPHNRRRTTRRWRPTKKPTRKPRIRMEEVDDITWIDNNDIVDLDNIMDNDDKFINDTYETLTDPLLVSVNPRTGSDLGKMLPEYTINGNLSIGSYNVSNNILV